MAYSRAKCIFYLYMDNRVDYFVLIVNKLQYFYGFMNLVLYSESRFSLTNNSSIYCTQNWIPYLTDAAYCGFDL